MSMGSFALLGETTSFELRAFAIASEIKFYGVYLLILLKLPNKIVRFI